MARPIQPTGAGTSGDATIGWAIVGAFFAGLASGTLLWVAAGLVGMASGDGWTSVGWSPMLLLDVFLKKGGIDGTWPNLDPVTVMVVWAVLVLALVAFPVWKIGKSIWNSPRSDDPLRSLAKPADVKDLLLPARRQQVRKLRPSMADKPLKEISETDAGMPMGRLARPSSTGPRMYAGYEDIRLWIMAPRSGKTTSGAVPDVLNAPGAVIATSNKSDLLIATQKLREKRTGERTWTFDPQHIAYYRQEWWWNPLPRITSVSEAERFAKPFIATVEDERSRDIWGPEAEALFANLVLAAASAGLTINEVNEWLVNDGDPAPVNILRRAGFIDKAQALASLQTTAPETKSSVYFTARAGTKCLADPQIKQWVTPGNAELEFDPRDFVQTRQTLYMLSKEGGGSAAPLVAALTDRILRTAMAMAESTGIRMDAPFLPVLDEAANVCPISDLPDLVSHLGSRGICPLIILQNPAQGVKVWGENGMKRLWSASTVKVIGSGADDDEFAEQISRLIGEHDVTTTSRTSGKHGSTSVSVRQQRILSAAQVRALPKGRGLMLATGSRAAMVVLEPWYEGPDAAEIGANIKQAEADIVARAKRYPHPLLINLTSPDTVPDTIRNEQP